MFKDRALALPPLTSTFAKRLMERTKIYTALKGVRGWKSVDLDELEQILVRFSELITEQRWIKELDINPLLASPDRLLALDARVVVYGPDVTEDELPKLAIRPYPTRYVSETTTKDGTKVTLRPIRPEDEPLMVKYHQSLSDQSVYLRYMHPMQLIDRVSHERLGRICHSDYDRQITLVAEDNDPETNQPRIIGASRLSKLHSQNAAQYTVMISDYYQGKGLGTVLLSKLIEIGRAEKLEWIEAYITSDNLAMQAVSKKLGFTISPTDS